MRSSRAWAPAALLLLSAAAAPPPVPSSAAASTLAPPSVLFGPLYRAVEMASVFPDQKTFADAVPISDPQSILAAYSEEKNRPGFDLAAFVSRHFMLPIRKSVEYRVSPQESVGAYINEMWTVLRRQPDEAERWSSLLPLPRPYIVPGGRFSEIYYWDSYFEILGLEQDGKHELARDMLDNMASLIARYGHVPNGNRTYYLSRSEPPLFDAMVEFIASKDGDDVLLRYLPLMQQEYDYWMDGADRTRPGQAYRHVVRLADGTLFNRYWDDRAAPRDESYREDVETALHARGRKPEEVWRDLRAGGESGWDFSSRWFADPHDITTIRTTAIAPIDLNAIMAHNEQVLARAWRRRGDLARARTLEQRAAARIAAIRAKMWDPASNTFQDYLWQEGRRTGVISVATVVPLYFGAATPAEAHAVAAAIRQAGILAPGGLSTTLVDSGQQWDRPNGWAPLHYMAIEGLKSYGEDALARGIAGRWIEKNINAYAVSGTLLEKYNVFHNQTARGGGGGGGEYPLQVGFGWTNGVLAVLMAEYKTEIADALQAHPQAAHPAAAEGAVSPANRPNQ